MRTVKREALSCSGKREKKIDSSHVKSFTIFSYFFTYTYLLHAHLPSAFGSEKCIRFSTAASLRPTIPISLSASANSALF